jgi:hypothetical protein
MAGKSPSAQGGYERRDTQVKILRAAGGAVGGDAGGSGSHEALFGYFASGRSAPAASFHPGGDAQQRPPSRGLNTPSTNCGECAPMRRGWLPTDGSKAGIVRIPIEQALDIAARGEG